MRTYTITEAAELTTLSPRALRSRVDRGQVRAVHRDGVRRIPHSELERTGILLEADPDTTSVVRELTDRLEAQARELAALRALPERVESYRQRVDELEHARAAALAERDQAQAARDEHAHKLALLARAGWRGRRRILRALRGDVAAAA